MKELEIWIVCYLLNSLWQVPLLAAAGWVATRITQSAGCVIEHRVWVAVLLLQSLLPAVCLAPWQWLQRLSFWANLANRSGEAQVSIAMGPGTGLGEFHLPGAMLMAIAIAYVTVAAYFAARFVWRGMAVSAIRREASAAVLPPEIAEFWSHCSRMFAVKNVSIGASSRIVGPVTLGVRRKLVLWPIGMLETLPEEDLKTIIAHEYSHINRQDFLKNLLYEWLALPIAYHPFSWFTHARIMESREMVCDEMAAGLNGHKHYARSLLRLARLLVNGTPATIPHTIGIFDGNTFERRIMNLSKGQKEVGGLRRVVIVAASAVLGLGVSGSAVAIAVHINPAATGTDTNRSKAPKRLSVSAEQMSGNLLNKAVPVYPPAAKKAKIQGAVVLKIVIGRDGNVENAQVISGPQELQQSALDAVRQWKYKPYLLNGDPIEVLTTVNIIYSLNG